MASVINLALMASQSPVTCHNLGEVQEPVPPQTAEEELHFWKGTQTLKEKVFHLEFRFQSSSWPPSGSR